MGRNRSVRIPDWAALVACAILAIACLIAAIYHVRSLSSLLERGERTEAVVTGFRSGARNARWAVYEFTTADGIAASAADIFQLYLHRPNRGDTLRVIYDPRDPAIVTADRGLWTWEGAGIFGFGTLLFVALWVLILTHSRKRGSN